MDTLLDRPLFLSPNRVWRTYSGGRTLDELEGRPAPADGHFPEDWIASSVRAVNPEPRGDREGIANMTTPAGESAGCDELLAADAEALIGPAAMNKFGRTIVPLTKFLDPAIRLPVQAHPTAEFARARLGSPFGKTEAYVVLSVRPEEKEPVVYLGFRKPVTRADWRRLIEVQDIPGMLACLHQVKVKPGDVLVVPGGWPHALGAGLFVLEMQEPSDWVVRCEFRIAGCEIPESARFMGRGLETALDVFDYRPVAPAELISRCRPARESLARPEGGAEERLLSVAGAFEVRRLTVADRMANPVLRCGALGVVTAGAGKMRHAGGETDLKPYDRFFIPFAGQACEFAGAGLQIVKCLPALAD